MARVRNTSGSGTLDHIEEVKYVQVHGCTAISISRCRAHVGGQGPLHWGTTYHIVSHSLQGQVELYMYHLKLTPTIIAETTEQNPIIEITHLKTRRHIIIVIIYEII